MQLVNEFSVDAPIDVAWSALTDIAKVVECVPGAELDRRDGDDYHAHVAIKVGPVGLTLAGMATLVSQDDVAREMVMRGHARDRKGNGQTEATVRMVARDDGGRSVVTVTADLEMSGRIAQFGKGAITQVSNRIIKQFVDRLNAAIVGDEPPTGQSVVAQAAPAPSGVAAHSEALVVALTALAGVAMGLAIGRLSERLSYSPH